MAFDPRWKNPPGPDVQQLYRWAQDLITELRRGAYFAQASSGFVSGPALSTDSGFAKWDGVTGKLLKDSNATIEEAELANDAVTYAKLQNISTQFRALGRNSSGAGDTEEVTLSQLLDWIGSAAQGDILYRGASSWVRLPAGTSGQFLQTQGAAADPQWAAPGMVLLASGTVVNAATLDLVLTGYTAYRGLVFKLISFVPQTDNTDLWMRVSTDGGNNFNAGAADYFWTQAAIDGAGAAANVADGSDSEIQLANSCGNAAGETADVSIELMDQTNTSKFPLVSAIVVQVAAAPTFRRRSVGGQRLTAQDTDAVRFMFSNGNIASGSYAVYGLA